MQNLSIDKLIRERVVFFDGPSGTLLQSSGLPVGTPPDEWNLERADVVRDIHRRYLEAGSDVISMVTFRAGTFDEGDARRIIEAAANNCREAIAEYCRQGNNEEERPIFTALDVGPSGKLLGLTDGPDFPEIYEYFRTQIIAGADAGADVILFETFTDVYELKTAVLAAKENCDLPVLATVTFESGGRTLMGTDPETAALMFRDMGLTAFGANCSLGPNEMLPIIESIAKYAKAPVMAKPNAGLPRMENGVAVYDILPAEFAEAVGAIAEAGARVVGGCCGSSPEYIEVLTGNIIESDIYSAPIATPTAEIYPSICATAANIIIKPGCGYSMKSLIIEDASDIKYISSSVKKLAKETDLVAIEITRNAIEKAEEIAYVASRNSRVPLAIKCSDAVALDEAMRVIRGKPAIIIQKEIAESCVKTAKKYGAPVIIEKGETLPGSTDLGRDRIIITNEGRLSS
jgi:5-methyltetrahydrofolate--homocysteine methyltransferase